MTDESTSWLVAAHAAEALDDLVGALRSGLVASPDDPRPLTRLIGESRALGGMHPVESIRAAADLFDIVARAGAECPDADADAAAFAAQALNTSMSLRIGEAVASYYGFLLDRLHHAQTDERRRLARELHDRVGGEVSIAARQLELYGAGHEGDPEAADSRVTTALRELASAMVNIRQLTADLRRNKPIESIEKSLRSFLDSAGSDAVETELVVNGDEAWLAPQSRDEIFLAIREALRNALQHARPHRILVRIAIAPHELRASVEDDGVGFDPDQLTPPRGQGIRSIIERMALLGGTARLSSLAGRGTKIEIHVPRAEVQDSAPLPPARGCVIARYSAQVGSPRSAMTSLTTRKSISGFSTKSMVIGVWYLRPR